MMQKEARTFDGRSDAKRCGTTDKKCSQRRKEESTAMQPTDAKISNSLPPETFITTIF